MNNIMRSEKVLRPLPRVARSRSAAGLVKRHSESRPGRPKLEIGWFCGRPCDRSNSHQVIAWTTCAPL
jgi:hypothetical protein